MDRQQVPDFLSHYYDSSRGPFQNLSMLPPAQAEQHLQEIRRQGDFFASRRDPDYLQTRRELEELVRELFVSKGGHPVLARPHYMVLGACSWLKSWYPAGVALQIPIDVFDPTVVSFTYGDTFPAMRYQDGRSYRGQVYTLADLPDLIGEFGLPQEWNPDGSQGPDRYIEAQVWDEQPLRKFLPGSWRS